MLSINRVLLFRMCTPNIYYLPYMGKAKAYLIQTVIGCIVCWWLLAFVMVILVRGFHQLIIKASNQSTLCNWINLFWHLVTYRLGGGLNLYGLLPDNRLLPFALSLTLKTAKIHNQLNGFMLSRAREGLSWKPYKTWTIGLIVTLGLRIG